MIKHKAPISGVAVFKNKYVATAGYDNQVILWDSASHMALARGLHDHLANQCQFSPAGNYLISTSSDYTARIWQVPEMKLISVLGAHKDDVESAVFSPDGNKIATSSRDGSVRVFALDGSIIYEFIGHQKDVISVLWLNDHEIISSSDDGTVRVWNLYTKSQSEHIDLGEIETDTIAIGNNKIIYAGNDDGNIIIINNGNIKEIKAHDAGIKRLCYSSEKSILASLSYDRTLMLWKIDANGEPVLFRKTSFPNIIWARSCAFLGDTQLVLASFGTTYAIYDYVNDNWDTSAVDDTQGINAVMCHQNNIYTIGDAGIVFKNDQVVSRLPGLCNFVLAFGNTAVAGGQTGEIYDINNGRVIYQHYSPLNCATHFTKDEKQYVIIGSYTGDAVILELDEYHIPSYSTTIKLHENAIKGIAANSQSIFSVCADNAAAFHSIKDFSLEKYLKNAHNKIANGCARLNEQDFISVSRDLSLRVFSTDNVEAIATSHRTSIKCIAVINELSLVATGDYAGTVVIYKDLKEILKLRVSSSGISSLSPNKDNDGFLASSYDGSVYPIFCKAD